MTKLISNFNIVGRLFRQRIYQSPYEPETITYIENYNKTLTMAQIAALDTNIKSIKYGSGIALSSATLNISNVTSYQFITNASVDLRPYILAGYKFVLTDTGGKTLTWTATRSVGTGETLGNDALSGGGSFTADTGWTLQDGYSIGSGILTAANGTGLYALYNLPTYIIIGALYKSSINILTISSAFSVILAGTPEFFGSMIETGSIVRYRTKTSLNQTLGLYRSVGTKTGTFDDLLIKQVLTPSATGGWFGTATVDAGFDYNSATYTITVTRN